MNVQDLKTALRMPARLGSTRCATCATCSTGRRRMTPSRWTAPRLHRLRAPSRGIPGRRRLPAAVLASALLLASCVGAGQPAGERNLPLIPTEAGETPSPPDTRTAGPAAQNGAVHSPATGPAAGLPDTGSHPPGFAGPPAAALDAPVPAAAPVPAHATPRGGRHVSLRPIDNVHADDLLDHWGHRPAAVLSGLLTQVQAPDEDVARFEDLLEAARGVGGGAPVPGLRDGDAVTVLGERRAVTYGRWSGGPADTLHIAFDLEHATGELQKDTSFRAALERAGKVWSRRIDDTWQEWERLAGESKGRLIGNYGADGREVRVRAGGETSTGLTVYVTGAELGDAGGIAGARSLRPDADWEPHTGAMAFDSDHLEEAGEAELFRTMVHEIGHVLGAWHGADKYGDDRPEVDRVAGTWTGAHVEAVHGGPAPFQDADDARGWHDGERSPDAERIDFHHSGVCSSVMAYCTDSAAIPAFLPSEIDFAFLADIGMTIRPQTLVPQTLVPGTLVPGTSRPETYGHAGWLDHSAFTVAVFRELEVSLADPQPRYVNSAAPWTELETVDLLWAEADAFGRQSTGGLAGSYPLRGTVRYAGGLIGTAVDIQCLPPVYGDASLSFGLEDLRGKASFTSLETELDGGRYVFGDGSLHYPVAVTAEGIVDEASGVSLLADFYGPRHEEVAGTLDDTRAGLLASFGARHDDRPAYLDAIEGADHVRGMMYRDGFGDDRDGWHRFRCGSAPGCEGRFEWWRPESAWYEVGAAEERTARERVLAWTAGWGEWMSADLFADRGAVRIERRHAAATDGGRGRYGEDGYYGTMTHAAFGTGFSRYDNWEAGDGGEWNFSIDGTGYQGALTGSRPAGTAVWEGRMVGHQSGLGPGEDPFVQGRAAVSVSLVSSEVDIDFSGVTSMDRARTVADFGFGGIPLSADGTFDGYDRGQVEGAFFGPAHEEVAGMFHNNANQVTGSFGAVGLD